MSAVTQQPNMGQMPVGQYQAMGFPGEKAGVPSGLEYMAVVDQLIAKQDIEVFEALTGWECKNKYRILNSMQQQAYYTYEESDTCHRLMCGPSRGFVFRVTDNNQQEIMSINRPFICCAGCNLCADGCCMYPIFVNDKFGQQMGMIRMRNWCCKPAFGIYDNEDRLLYDVQGRCCPFQCVCGCTGDVDYPITDVKTNEPVGKISKIWGGFFREAVTRADTYCVRFPMELDVRMKALMFASIFLIDMSIYEQQKKNNN